MSVIAVERTRIGHVLVVTLSREEKRNALNADITAGIDAAMNELGDDADLWCGILTGGHRFFSAGADLAVGPEELRPLVEIMINNQVTVCIDVERVRSWDHRKLGMGKMEVGGSTAEFMTR